jgi:hypothetical protein
MSETQRALPNIETVVRRLTECKGTVLAIAQLPVPHLMLCCIKLPRGGFVVWKINIEVTVEWSDCGCFDGGYHTVTRPDTAVMEENKKNAIAEFSNRLAIAWSL